MRISYHPHEIGTMEYQRALSVLYNVASRNTVAPPHPAAPHAGSLPSIVYVHSEGRTVFEAYERVLPSLSMAEDRAHGRRRCLDQ